jgi:glutamyl-tRNA synthetase
MPTDPAALESAPRRPATERPAVVRIAPSPTGDPHVGTAYVALFNYLVARRSGGRFILRIEDTDQARYDPDSERKIVESLRWLGLTWDEGPDVGGPSGPYRQSERTEIYRRHVEVLLDRGTAYRCHCTEERLQEMRLAQRARKAPPGYDGHCRHLGPEEAERLRASGTPFVVRLRVPKERTVVFRDEIRGDVRIEGHTIDDQVLLKSDGFPTYHLANVVDDHLMGVTEVIRAEEWIVSTPKHVLLYEAFGWEAPLWRHMPLLRNADRSKISKRKNPTSLTWYRDQGYLPEALLNFLALMGWSHPKGLEVFDLAAMQADFDVTRVSASGPVFDLDKLAWLDGEYLRKLSPDEFARRLLEHFRERRRSGATERDHLDDALQAWVDRRGGYGSGDVAAFLRATVPLVQERVKTLTEYAALARCFFLDDVSGYEGKDLAPKGRGASEVRDVLARARERLAALAWDAPAPIEAALRGLGDEIGWKVRDLLLPVRVAVTGSPVSPPLFESMHLVGKDACLARLAAAERTLGG